MPAAGPIDSPLGVHNEDAFKTVNIQVSWLYCISTWEQHCSLVGSKLWAVMDAAYNQQYKP